MPGSSGFPLALLRPVFPFHALATRQLSPTRPSHIPASNRLSAPLFAKNPSCLSTNEAVGITGEAIDVPSRFLNDLKRFEMILGCAEPITWLQLSRNYFKTLQII